MQLRERLCKKAEPHGSEQSCTYAKYRVSIPIPDEPQLFDVNTKPLRGCPAADTGALTARNFVKRSKISRTELVWGWAQAEVMAYALPNSLRRLAVAIRRPLLRPLCIRLFVSQ